MSHEKTIVPSPMALVDRSAGDYLQDIMRARSTPLDADWEEAGPDPAEDLTEDNAADPAPSDSTRSTGSESDMAEAASRGLIFVAAMLIIVPAAIGLYILRSGKTPAPPGAAEEQLFVPPALGSDPADGPTSADLLQPANKPTSRIRYQAGGDTENLANRGIVPLSNGMSVQVTVSPFPPTEFTTDIEFTLTDAAGGPVTDAVVNAEWDMVMVHGPFYSSFEHVGDGHYRAASFDFFMYGPWQLETTIATPAGDAAFKLAVFVWPE